MCSSTNFIKTLELNELVNHIAKLGAQKEKSLNPLPSFLHLFPAQPPFLSFSIFSWCGLKNNFRKQKCNERRNEL